MELADLAPKAAVTPRPRRRTRRDVHDGARVTCRRRGSEPGLSADEVGILEAAVSADDVAGTRYAAPLMAALDSER